MTWGQPLGLDELMIVNPGIPDDANTVFLGGDGNLYAFQPDEGLGEFFLGDDGTLYQLQRYSAPEPSPVFSSSLPKRRSRCGCRRRSNA